MLRIGIVGLGSWGVCALERIVTTARTAGGSRDAIEVHVFEPRTPGPGIYDVGLPDYLRLNNACGEISLYPFQTEDDQPAYAVGLFDWACREGYRWVGEACRRDPRGTPLSPHDYLPRRLMGEYLSWFYRALVAEAPAGMTIVHHPASVVDLISRRDGSELAMLDDGSWLRLDHVIVTSGHTANRPAAGSRVGVPQRNPFPVDYADDLPDGANVGISGFGLVGLDVVTALTIGRGGSFIEASGGLTYRRSGREPVLHLFSRSGLPFTGKSVTGQDRTDVYVPVICTPEALAALSIGPGGARRAVDLRGELLPLLFGEMYARYFAQVAFDREGIDAARGVRRGLAVAATGKAGLTAEIDGLRRRFGHYDAERHFFGPQRRYESGADYQADVYAMLAEDLVEARAPGGRSPLKAAAEVFRIFRDPMRSVVEHGGLSLESHLDFSADVVSRIRRLVAGPPSLRTTQFLALMDAGVLRVDLGPAPALAPAPAGSGGGPDGVSISSALLVRPEHRRVELLIKGHLEEPRVDGSASALLQRLYAEGRLSPFRYGSVSVGSVNLTVEGHPIDADGHPQERVWMFGVLTEGIRHFTYYVPSPKSRIRAVHDIGNAVASILA